jgi:hypothetical protein
MAKTPTSDPAKTAAKADAAPADTPPATREFTATRAILHDGETYNTGEPVVLTKTQHAPLFALGAVAEAWPD